MAGAMPLVRALSHWLSAHKAPALAADMHFPPELLDDKFRVGSVCVLACCLTAGRVSNELCAAVLLVGPPGACKTSAVYACAQM